MEKSKELDVNIYDDGTGFPDEDDNSYSEDQKREIEEIMNGKKEETKQSDLQKSNLDSLVEDYISTVFGE